MKELISELQNTKSAKRRSAAKKIRKLKDLSLCSPLMDALKLELLNKKTWETQYQLIMAIAESNCTANYFNLILFIELSELEPMVRLALADAITRLGNNSRFLEYALQKKDLDFVSGALRAMSFKQIQIPIDLVDELIDFMTSFKNDMSYFWIAAAAPGCNSNKLNNYLHVWKNSINDDISKAAKAALENKYLKWSIL